MSEIIRKLSYAGKSVIAVVKDATEHQQKCWMAGNFYETQRNGLLNHIYKNHRNCQFLDIGASIGNHSLFFAGVCGATGVISVEPYPPSFQHLEQNIAVNSFGSIISPLNVAVGDKESTVKVGLYGKGNVGMVAIGETGIEVPYTTVDWLIESSGFPLPQVVKIDVEHHNLPVLMGMRRLLKTGPVIYIEAESQPQFLEVHSFFKEHGYRFTGAKFNHTPTYEFVAS